jgi:fluoride exporter
VLIVRGHDDLTLPGWLLAYRDCRRAEQLHGCVTMMELTPYTPYLLVGIGSAFGGVLRYGLSQLIDRQSEVGAFPWGILIVNLIGCFIMGVAFVLLERTPLKTLVMTGILGGFTTFSAFSLITLELFQRGRFDLAIGYVAASVIGCLLAVWIGVLVTSALRGSPGP